MSMKAWDLKHNLSIPLILSEFDQIVDWYCSCGTFTNCVENYFKYIHVKTNSSTFDSKDTSD